MERTLFDVKPRTRGGIAGRDYQIKAHDNCFRHWNDGARGCLIRSATGTGKTIMGSLIMDTWLRRGDSFHCMVISYETQLVWQFAQEIEDILGIKPGIEMDSEQIRAGHMPRIVVASRASLLRAKPPTPEQRAELMTHGVRDTGPAPERIVKRFLRHLRSGGDVADVLIEIARLRQQPEAHESHWSRLHKFDWRLNWLLIFDEAHRHAYHLTSVGPLVDWFDQNPLSRRAGLTATPRRGDNISIGDRMFPAIALDYPLYLPSKPCAVGDGWAVPYVQRYIEVEGVDFKSLGKIGDDFDEAELERKLGDEATLAKLVLPLLAMVGDRRTLIFSPGVQMARDVAWFINARVEIRCRCGQVSWLPRLLVGDGAACSCGRMAESADITKSGEMARQLDGSSPEQERRKTYQAHQQGRFQFLSVCALCREGYNDPDVACVAIFRPVSRDAASLAEQMKGRGCRPLRGLVNGLETREERLAAIAASQKPNCLIVDLVGATGLPDCATTASVYAEGVRDGLADDGHDEEDATQLAQEILARVEEILLERGKDEEVPVEEAIAQAKRESLEAREKAQKEREEAERRAREEAERRARAGAEVRYTTHEVGHGHKGNVDPLAASEAQYRYAAFLGLSVLTTVTKRQMGRIINLLRQRKPLQEVARLCGLDEGEWQAEPASARQLQFLWGKGIRTESVRSKYDASLLLDATFNLPKFRHDRQTALASCRNPEELDGIARDLMLVRGVLPESDFAELVAAGKVRRQQLSARDEGLL